MVSSLRLTPVLLGIVTVFALILIATPHLSADVIYFLDGNVLIVDKAWIEGDQVKYETSRGVQSVARVGVREIKEQNAPPPPGPQRWGFGVIEKSPNTSRPTSSTSAATLDSAETLSRLRGNLRVDPSSSKAKADLAYALASVASLQLAEGDLGGAAASLEEARRLDGNNLAILENLAVIHLKRGHFREAESLLQSGLQIDSSRQDLHYLLGMAYYGQEKVSEAINQWSRGLRLGPHGEMSRSLEKARRELRVHDEMGTMQSAHFILRYDREVSDRRLGQTLLATLERLYTRLSIELVSRPPATIAVILYPDQDYFDITRTASWSGALFDGKIRIPTRGLSGTTPQLEAVLIHELTHAFLAGLEGSCPTWFNEGLAMFKESRSAEESQEELARLYKEDRLIRLEDLKGSFLGFSARRAELAYLESLSAVEYLISRFGTSSVRNILDLIAQNHNFENAFRTVLRRSVSEFETAWQQSLSN